MRCLYCGKELALLKRLTRSGEFCSEAHKQSYQEEYNRLGLSRLLQARSKTGENQAEQKPPATKAAPAAVAEPPVEEVAEEKVARTAPAPPPPVMAAPPPVIAAPPEPPPPAAAGFFIELPPIVIASEPEPYLQPSMPDEVPPPTPAWRLESPTIEHAAYSLRSAELLPLEVQPGVCENGQVALDTDVAPKDFAHPRVNLSMPLTITWSHNFQPGGSVPIEIAPRPSESSCYASLSGAIDFSFPAAVQSLELLELSPSGIAYPAEDCDVTFPETWTNGIITEPNGFVSEGTEITSQAPVDIAVPPIPQAAPEVEPPAKPAPAAKQEATPRAALEALSKLHKNMREREEAKPAAPPAEPRPEKVAAVPTASVAESTEPAPREASELLPISLKSFAPPKATPMIDTKALLSSGSPVLPRLKALPLRPKVAPAPRGFAHPAKTAPSQNPAAEAKPKPAPSVTPPPAEAAPKPQATSKPAQPSAQNAKPAPAAKPSQAPQAKVQATEAKKPAQPAEAAKAKPPVPPSPTISSAPAPATPPQPEQQAKPIPVKSAPAAPKAPPPQPQKPEPAKTVTSPAKTEATAKTTAAKTEPSSKAAMAASSSSAATSGDDTVPNFGAVVNTSMFGSLKVKAGIGALAAVLAVGGYVMFVGKSKTAGNPTKVSDGVGPSIMVGEGGWVEGWAGDPTGYHSGRQITIYRPSLKLSDYRIEFQGQIETKSIGWIFRAANPENYYAMKLQLVSPELPLTVVLYKYIVLKGRQVQVGRVPIEVPVKNDTVFSVRVDVRGPKFSTSVQGQPVDVWTDDQLKSGGMGFLNERDERGKIKSVSLSLLSGGTK